jgi:hypothetical protein
MRANVDCCVLHFFSETLHSEIRACANLQHVCLGTEIAAQGAELATHAHFRMLFVIIQNADDT